MNNEHLDWIYLSKIGFPCIVGLYEDEQRTPQRLELELAMGLDLEPAAAGDLAQSVHYVAALDQVQFIAEEGRWRLLESLAAAIARHLLRAPAPGEGRAAIQRVKVRVAKPAYLKGRAVPSVEIMRQVGSVSAESVAPPTGSVEVHALQLTRQSGAYHVDLGPHADFVVPDGASCFLVAGRLVSANGSELQRGAILRGGQTASTAPSVHSANAALPARLLLVGRPLGAVE